MDRRKFLKGAGLSAVAGTVGVACGPLNGEDDQEAAANVGSSSAADIDLSGADWGEIRGQFELDPEPIFHTAFLFSSHPRAVREAIERHRAEFDANPAEYLEAENNELTARTREAAASYLGTSGDQIALTDSTTMGLGLVYNGLRLGPDDEILTTDHDYYATHASLNFAAERTGASINRITLYQDPSTVTEDEIVSNIENSLTDDTRVVAVTWVHSMNGVKIPVSSIAEVVADANNGRAESDRILLCVDGVHGFGIENVTVDELGCDFLISGCHKWLFGPRGTGIVWGTDEAWSATRPTIPSFIDSESWTAWTHNQHPPQGTTAARMTPGGFKPYEHQWAMIEAFRFHQEIGKQRIADRTHELNGQLKEAMAEMPNVQLHTPLSPELSSGMVCFDMAGQSPGDVRGRLRDLDILATTTPYADSHARLGASIINTREEMERTLEGLHQVA